MSGCSTDWQIYHFLAFFPQSDHYLVGHVKVSILISTDTEKPQLSMKFPYKTYVSFSFLDIYCLEHIYYSAGSSNAKLAQEANQRGRQGLQNKEEKIENKIMTFPLVSSCCYFCLLQLETETQHSSKELTFTLASCQTSHMEEHLPVCCSVPIHIGITWY